MFRVISKTVLIHHPFQHAKPNKLFILISCSLRHGVQISFFLTKFARSFYRTKIENEVIIAATLRRSQCRRILGLMDSESRRSNVRHTHPSSFVTAIHYASPPLVLCLPATSESPFSRIQQFRNLISASEIGFSLQLKKFSVSTSQICGITFSLNVRKMQSRRI